MFDAAHRRSFWRWRRRRSERGSASGRIAHVLKGKKPVGDELLIAGRAFDSRLFVGSGKFRSAKQMLEAIESSGARMVTVALRRVDIDDPADPILASLDRDRYFILPNTSGARSAEEAVKLARLARAAGISDWVKLEVTPEPRYLLPDPLETYKAAKILIEDGFTVLPYIGADPLLAARLTDLGVATVMPLGSPIGANRGLRTKDMLKIIIEQARAPVVIDAGLGSPSDAAAAMELGADAVLVNTAIAAARDPRAMARAFKVGVEAGRAGYLAGLARQIDHAEASSPTAGLPWE